MNEFISLKFVCGSLSVGFKVILNINSSIELEGNLPPNPQLADLFFQWQSSYQKCSLLHLSRELSAPKIQVTNYSVLDSARDLEVSINQWLDSQEFRDLRDEILTQLKNAPYSRITIQTDEPILWQLPWELWSVLKNQSKSTVNRSLSSYEAKTRKIQFGNKNKVKVLVIWGEDSQLNLEKDLKVLATQLPKAEIETLIQPKKEEISYQLWEKNWDILFFAGHSSTQKDNQQGFISINSSESIALEELRDGLNRAIDKSLKLAIFNSCDGLGLGRSLASLQIPATIVMREPVPDRIAHKFLEFFLKAFANKQQSLSVAVREAKDRLYEEESQYPCASWLPAICLNPGEEELTWAKLFGEPDKMSGSTWVNILLSSAIVTSAIVGMRSLGWLQPLELHAFDRMIQTQPLKPADDRILVITVDENDIQYQDELNMNLRGSLADDAFAVLLEKLSPHQPRVIASDIVHDFEFESNLGTRLQQNDRFIVLCRIRDEDNNLASISPPPGIPNDRLGFTNIPPDPDGVIRRYTLGMSQGDKCTTDNSLGLQIVLHYLQNEPTPPPIEYPPLKIGNVVIPKLQHHAGGYQLPLEEALGYQILLNHRFEPAENVALRDILQGSFDNQLHELVNDRIVLIGVAHEDKDRHPTPYVQGQQKLKQSGVFIHAQTVTQLLSVILDEQPLPWWWPQWGENFWIGGWALMGGAIVCIWKRPRDRGITLSIAMVGLYSFCWVIWLQGGWIPFIPSALALASGSGWSIAYRIWQKQTLGKNKH